MYKNGCSEAHCPVLVLILDYGHQGYSYLWYYLPDDDVAGLKFVGAHYL